MWVGVLDAAATRELRRAVLRPGAARHEPLPGDELSDAIHLGAVDADDTVLGTCFVYPDPCPWLPGLSPAWHLRQMATAPGHRGRGIGAAVLQAALDHVRQQRARLLWCHARQSAVPFYARHGFARHGAPFDVAIDAQHTVPHLGMWRELTDRSTSSEG